MKKVAPKYLQSSRVHGLSARLINYLLSYNFAFNLLITLGQIAMYWLALEVGRG